MQHEFKFDLGSKVKDRFTEFTGVVVAAYANLCSGNTYGVQANALCNEQPVSVYCLDEERLELVKDQSRQLGFINDVGWRTSAPAAPPSRGRSRARAKAQRLRDLT